MFLLRIQVEEEHVLGDIDSNRFEVYGVATAGYSDSFHGLVLSRPILEGFRGQLSWEKKSEHRHLFARGVGLLGGQSLSLVPRFVKYFST